MRIRMGLFGWLCIGWIIIPTWILFQMFKGATVLFLGLMKALDKHNRRRSVRKAYERDRVHQRAAVASGQPYAPWSPPRPQVPVYPAWQPGERPAWQCSGPQDDPRWTGRR